MDIFLVLCGCIRRAIAIEVYSKLSISIGIGILY